MIPIITRDDILGPGGLILSLPVRELEISVRAANCLKNNGPYENRRPTVNPEGPIEYVGQLVMETGDTLGAIASLGSRTVRELRDVLKPLHLRLGMAFSIESKKELLRLFTHHAKEATEAWLMADRKGLVFSPSRFSTQQRASLVQFASTADEVLSGLVKDVIDRLDNPAYRLGLVRLNQRHPLKKHTR